MNDVIRRFLWSWVAFRAAWDMYPKPTTVLPNEEIDPIIKICESLNSARRYS